MVGHVSWDERAGDDVLGGSASFAAITAARLGWQVALATAAGAEFEPSRELPGVSVFRTASATTTRFRNDYDPDGRRRQRLLARAVDVDFEVVPSDWRTPDVLLLAPVAGELAAGASLRFPADVVGAFAQGWLRHFGQDGGVTGKDWPHPERDLAGVGFLFASLEDVGGDPAAARRWLPHVELIALTRGGEGVDLIADETAARRVLTLKRPEVDPTGAGDVFGAAFLARYHETGDVGVAARFGCAAASCAVEGIGTTAIPDREALEARLELLPS